MNIFRRSLVSKVSRVVKINDKINLENIKYELKSELLNDFNKKLLANNNIQSKNLIEFEKQLSDSIMKNVKDEINQRSEYIFNKKINENNMKVINKNLKDFKESKLEDYITVAFTGVTICFMIVGTVFIGSVTYDIIKSNKNK
jgi:hypothetical protein